MKPNAAATHNPIADPMPKKRATGRRLRRAAAIVKRGDDISDPARDGIHQRTTPSETMADEEAEFTRLTKARVFAYKIPPRRGAAGHVCVARSGRVEQVGWTERTKLTLSLQGSASDWKEQIFCGDLRVASKGTECRVILFEKESGKVFAVCPIRRDGPQAVEKVTDSSRYFALRIENAAGKHMYIGLGFSQRTDAFDFQVALQEHNDEVERRVNPKKLDLGEAESLSLGGIEEGQKIRIAVKGKIGASGDGAKTAGSSGGGIKPPPSAGGPAGGGFKLAKLAPPPERSPGGAAAAAAGSSSRAAPTASSGRPVASSSGAAGGGDDDDDILGLGSAMAGMSVAAAPAPAPAAAAAASVDDDMFFGGAPAPAPAPTRAHAPAPAPAPAAADDWMSF